LTHVASASAPIGCHNREVRYSLGAIPVTSKLRHEVHGFRGGVMEARALLGFARPEFAQRFDGPVFVAGNVETRQGVVAVVDPLNGTPDDIFRILRIVVSL
jgi:hypothetical protein